MTTTFIILENMHVSHWNLYLNNAIYFLIEQNIYIAIYLKQY